MTKLKTNKLPPPRNPFVALAKFKKAGCHRKSNKAMRMADKQKIKKMRGDSEP